MTILRKDESIDSALLTYFEVLFSIVLLGIIGQIVIVFLPIDFVKVSIGWWIGIGGAVFMETHLYNNLKDIVLMNELDADKSLRTNMFIRYGVILFVMAIAYLTGFANPVAFIFGVLMLKPAVYMQPLVDKIYIDLDKNRFRKGSK